MKYHRSSKKFSNISKKIHSTSRCFKWQTNKNNPASFKLIKQYDAQLKLAAQKTFRDSDIFKIYQTKMPLIPHEYALPHEWNSRSFSQSSSGNLILPRDNNLLYMIIEKDTVNLLIFFSDQLLHIRVTKVSKSAKKTKLSRALLLLHITIQPRNLEIPDAHLLHFLWGIRFLKMSKKFLRLFF